MVDSGVVDYILLIVILLALPPLHGTWGYLLLKAWTAGVRERRSRSVGVDMRLTLATVSTCLLIASVSQADDASSVAAGTILQSDPLRLDRNVVPTSQEIELVVDAN
jgi:hypothetical protein